MKKLNLKGATPEAVIGVFTLLLALVNAVLQMLGYSILPIGNDSINDVISILFLIGTTLWNTWKNRNISTASQKAQEITDMIKKGEVLVDEIDEVIQKFKNREN